MPEVQSLHWLTDLARRRFRAILIHAVRCRRCIYGLSLKVIWQSDCLRTYWTERAPPGLCATSADLHLRDRLCQLSQTCQTLTSAPISR